MRWFTKAANQGVPNAQFNLGVLYYRGEGVQRDIGQMLSWIKKSADQGFMPAAYQLGVIYENGVGVTPDPALALNWYQRAAAGDHPRAQERVKAMIARTGLANIEDLPPMRAASREEGRRNDALGGIPTFIRTASDTGNAAPRPDKPAATMTDALPSPPAPAAHSAAVTKPDAPRATARTAEPAARPATTQAAKPAEPPPAPRLAGPAPAPVATAQQPTVAAAADAKAPPAPSAEPAAKPGTPPVTVASRSPEPRAGSRVFMVQLGSQPSEALAKQTWASLSQAFPNALAGQAPVYKSVELSGRGTFTRVFVGPFDQRDQAKAVCANIAERDSKQGCLVLSVTP